MLVDFDVLTEVSRLAGLPEEDRFILADQIAWKLGPEWEAHDQLAGEDRLPVVRHLRTRMLFAVIPGGSYFMGMTEEEEMAAINIIGGDRMRTAPMVAWYAAAARRAIASPMSFDVEVIVVAVNTSNPPATAALSA